VGGDRVSQFWGEFVAATGIDGEHSAWGFGNTPEMMTELGLLVRNGPKRATASLRSWYDDGDPMPRPGDLSVVLDGDGEPLCVIRTTGVDVRTFAAVDEDFAWAEGEGDRSLTHWRTVHLTFFASEGRPADDDTEVVLERFELLWP
jgi:uncharacterized protein YhfF